MFEEMAKDEKYTIIVVDDTMVSLQLLKNMLTPEGYNVELAKNGLQAFEILKTTSPDLILLDIMMPDMDGYEVCKKLKNNDQTKNIPVIFITALNDISNETRGFELGAVDYIIKPYKAAIVKARIKTHLKLKRKTDLLERYVSLDGLTEIPNRRRFDVVLEMEYKRSQRNDAPIAVLMIDIDHFKQFNDNYGHAAGDECLKRFAKILASTIKRPSDFVARYGGEEFVIILPDTDKEGAIKIANDVSQKIQQAKIPHNFSPVSNFITASIGCASVTTLSHINHMDIIKIADRALYMAKEEGRNKVKYFKDEFGKCEFCTWV